MAVVTLEQRVEALEEEVARLKAERGGEKAEPWWERRFGAFRDDPAYDEAMRLAVDGLTKEVAPMQSPREQLNNLGFAPAGAWTMEAGCLCLQLDTHQRESNILYAFVSGDAVLYIGKSVRQLGQRLYGYKRPGSTQRTNLRNHDLLLDALAREAAIEILVLAPSERLMYRGWPVSVAAGLEDTMIARLNPPWNRTGGSATLE